MSEGGGRWVRVLCHDAALYYSATQRLASASVPAFFPASLLTSLLAMTSTFGSAVTSTCAIAGGRYNRHRFSSDECKERHGDILTRLSQVFRLSQPDL